MVERNKKGDEKEREGKGGKRWMMWVKKNEEKGRKYGAEYVEGRKERWKWRQRREGRGVESVEGRKEGREAGRKWIGKRRRR